MDKVYIKYIDIERIRHLHNIELILDANEKSNDFKHILFTGKNGSGKTSVLNAIEKQLSNICQVKDFFSLDGKIKGAESALYFAKGSNQRADEINKAEENLSFWNKKKSEYYSGISLSFNCDEHGLRGRFEKGEFILAYFKAERTFDAIVPRHVEKVKLKSHYMIEDDPRKDFIKYLVDKKVSQSLYASEKNKEQANRLAAWFDSFEKMLKKIFEDESLRLEFDVKDFSFKILEDGREPFDFGTMADGYAAVLDIVVGIMMRMEAVSSDVFMFDMPGIVLIDELETHLHYEMQKKVLPFLCSVFPNVQFIISTHSAFILNSVENAVIYDLENGKLIQNGLANLPYEGIIKGYFEVDSLSRELREKFDRYREIVTKKNITDADIAEIPELELYLDEIPDYLALGVTTEYRRLKAEFEKREDL